MSWPKNILPQHEWIRNVATSCRDLGKDSIADIKDRFPGMSPREMAMVRQWIVNGRPLNFED